MINKIFTNQDCCYVFAADQGYLALTAVAIKSIIDKAKKDEYYDIILLVNGDYPEDEKKYQQLVNCPNISIRFFNMSSVMDSSDYYVANREGFKGEAYYRLATPWVLESGYKRALYLDGDMLIQSDLSVLLGRDMHGKSISAVRDYWGISDCYKPVSELRDYRQSIGLNSLNDYVISATLLFDLEKIRRNNTLNDVLHLCSRKEWKQHDQDVVNLLFKDDIDYIGPTYGLVSDYGNNYLLPQWMQDELNEAESNPQVVHFAAGRKPYSKPYERYDIEFWDTAKATPYFLRLLRKIKAKDYLNYVVFNADPHEIVQSTDLSGVIYREYYDLILGPLCRITVNKLQCHGDNLLVEGFATCHGISSNTLVEVSFSEDESRIDVAQFDNDGYSDNGEFLFRRKHFFVSLNITKECRLIPSVKIGDVQSKIEKIEFTRSAPFNDALKKSYIYSKKGWLIKRPTKEIIIEKGLFLRLFAWIQLENELLRKGNQAARHSALLRVGILILKIWKRNKSIELVGQDGVIQYKVIDQKRNSIDESVHSISKNSHKHKLLILASDAICCSDDDVINPFSTDIKYYQDIVRNIYMK